MALSRAVGDLAGTLLSMARTRLELFALEAGEQKARLIGLLALLCAAAFFLALAVLVLSVTVALYFWPTPYRYMALWLLGLLYLVLGIAFAWTVRVRLRGDPLPFSATLDELRRDAALFGRLREPGAAHADGRDGAPENSP
ncbi:MAG TPA: phage holin family protein [Burkholderiaceae bacterium]|nr:phage holin family protein [Burkholderiaceae bacterium]